MDKKHCGECKQEINDLEPLRCGFCEAFLHISQNCCGINSRGLKEAFAQGKLLLMCTSCREMLAGRSISAYIAEIPSTMSVPPASVDLPAQMKQLSEVVEGLSRKIDRFAGSTSQSTWPAPSTPSWPQRNKKRKLDDKPEKPKIHAPSDCGTNEVDLSDLSVPSIVRDADKFWLYLSALNPRITDSDVQKIVSRCLNTPDPVEVIRLVPKDKNTAGWSFVSYKIGLCTEMKAKALDPSSWPTGLRFREFIDQQKNWDRQPISCSPEV